MIYDSIYGYFKGYNTLDIVAHHFLLIIMILEVLISHRSGHEIIYCFLIGELSNPFLNIMTILDTRDGDYEKSKFYFQVIFFVLFLFLRFFIYTVLYGIQMIDGILWIKSASTVLFVLSVYWMWLAIDEALTMGITVKFDFLIF